MNTEVAGLPGTDGSANRPERSHLQFPVVGLGASAGGIATAMRFFEHMPSQSGMAFVIVFHLSPEHESNAAAILQRATRMPVVQVTEPQPIEANHVYVIAPAMHIAMNDGGLIVGPRDSSPARPVAIDVFFRTLAQAHGERAVAVVLSGTGSDGSVGLSDVKREGGISMAQLPSDAEYEGMPATAIATGLVDFVLPAGDMAAKLCELWANASKIELLDADAIELTAHEPVGAAVAEAEAAVYEILSLLHSRTGNDFQHYKRATVLRRLERRMQVSARPSLPAYRDYFRTHSDETAALLQDMLISVTSFFRDRESFEALERELMGTMSVLGERPWRAWVAGCATGEEAYSIAMLARDHAPPRHGHPIQIFASDIDERALGMARQGIYAEGARTDVPPTRLREYLEYDGGVFRVKRTLREQITFARHNLLREPPFSRMDLVCCRNLLIYFDREVQTQVLEMFHFALRTGGLLFLGSAETADWLPELFEAVDKRHRIYRARPAPRRLLALGSLSVEQMPPLPIALPLAHRRGAEQAMGQINELHVPASVLVDRQMRIVYVAGGAGRYLRYSEGVPKQGLLSEVVPELAIDLEAALLHCLHTGERTSTRPVRWSGVGNKIVFVHMSVVPNGTAEAATIAVRFEEFDYVLSADAADDGHAGEPATGEQADDPLDPARAVLHEEIRRLRAQLSGMVGESATSTEALRSSNEELQSINEELRSASEELETSKEELQSVNEELTTVNYQLKTKVEETAKANDDLNNLIESMDIATVFVNRDIRIQRFTPRADEIFNVLPSDVGRPLPDLTHRVNYPDMVDDVRQVLKSLRPTEREVAGDGDRWYLARISRYRTAEDRIAGAVLNFIDISERKLVQEKLRIHDERLRVVADETEDYAIMTLDAQGNVTSWNKGAHLMFGYSEHEMLGESFARIFLPEDRAHDAPGQELGEARAKGRALDERWHLRKDGSRVYCSGTTTRMPSAAGDGFAKICSDLTERQLLEKQKADLLEAEKGVRQKLEAADAMRSEFMAVMSHELKNPLNLIMMNAELITRSPEATNSVALRRAAESIRRTVLTQSIIIDDLLDLARVQTGKLAVDQAPVDIRQVIERTLSSFEQDARNKGIELSVACGAVSSAHADEGRVEQILWNLVSNAIKFTPARGRVEIRTARDGEYVRIDVSDTGRGIGPAMLPRVFDMFAQAEGPVSKRRNGGLGIGLALVKQLAELHGGRVAAESAGLDQGATISVWLPVTSDRADVSNAPGHSSFKGLRVLLVEDDIDTLELFKAILEGENADVTTASSAHSALRAAQAHDFDLLISDIGMPDMDGLQLIQQLRHRPATAALPAIAVTGFGKPADVARAREAGFDEHLQKPLSMDKLRDAVQRLVRR